MKYSIILVALMATLGLSACEKTVVTPAASPGPAGATGATGATGSSGSAGATGNKGDTGKTGDTVVVVPPK